MADNNTVELKIKVTGDKSGLADIKASLIKDVEEIKAKYQAITIASKKASQQEVEDSRLTQRIKARILEEQANKYAEIEQRKVNEVKKTADVEKQQAELSKNAKIRALIQSSEQYAEIEQRKVNEVKKTADVEKQQAELSKNAKIRALIQSSEQYAEIQRRQLADSKLAGQSSLLGSLSSMKVQASSIKDMLRTGLSNTGIPLTTSQVELMRAKLAELNPQIKKGEQELRGLGTASKRSAAQLLEMGENITVVAAGLKTVFGGMFNVTKEAITSAAELEELRGYFRGTEEDLESFRKATNRTVSTGDLIKLSNQALDLGISLEKQPVLFLLAKQSAEKYGTDVSSAFEKVVLATEGNVRGLKAVGIQKAVFNQILNDLVKSKGGELQVEQGLNEEQTVTIKNLDAVTQKQLRLEAVLQASGKTMKDVNNQQQTNADKLRQLDLLIPQVKRQFGELVAGGIIPLTDSLRNSEGGFNKASVAIAGLVMAGGQLLPMMASMKIAFGGAFVTSLGIWGGAIAGITAHLLNLKFAFEQVKLAFSGDWRLTLGGKLWGADQTDTEENRKNEMSWFEKYGNAYKLAKDRLQKFDDLKNKVTQDTKKPDVGKTGSRGAMREDKQELDDIQKLIEEINALEAKRGFYLSSYPEYLGIQVKLLDDIKKKQEELNDLRGTSLKQVSLSGFEIPEETPGLRESALSVLNDIAMEKARTQLELLTTKAENLRDALMPMTDAFGKFFGVLANGESTGNAFKELLKTIATQFISFLEIQYFASAASTFFKAILSAGLTLTSDLVWQFLGLSALETAKGLIGALETGGPVNKSGMYLVGESGPEIRYLNAGGGVMNNNDTMRYLNARQNNSSNIVNQINVQVSGLLRDLVKVGIEQVNQRNAVLDY